MGAISTKTAAERKLERLETEINREAFEAFYHVGQKLLDIRDNRRYESAGFNSWGAYCASGRIDYKKRTADDYIRCSELRPKLGDNLAHEFGIWQVLELCKCETDNDAKRVAKAAIRQAKKSGERVTAKLIAKVRDRDTGQDVREFAAASLDKHLDKLASILVRWHTSLGQIADEQWEEVDSEILARVRNESSALNKFLRS